MFYVKRVVISDAAVSSVFFIVLYAAKRKEKELMEREISWKLYKNKSILEKLNYFNVISNMLLEKETTAKIYIYLFTQLIVNAIYETSQN